MDIAKDEDDYDDGGSCWLMLSRSLSSVQKLLAVLRQAGKQKTSPSACKQNQTMCMVAVIVVLAAKYLRVFQNIVETWGSFGTHLEEGKTFPSKS